MKSGKNISRKVRKVRKGKLRELRGLRVIQKTCPLTQEQIDLKNSPLGITLGL